MTDRELLVHIHELARKALFERTFRSAAREALAALSEIDKLTAQFK